MGPHPGGTHWLRCDMKLTLKQKTVIKCAHSVHFVIPSWGNETKQKTQFLDAKKTFDTGPVASSVGS